MDSTFNRNDWPESRNGECSWKPKGELREHFGLLAIGRLQHFAGASDLTRLKIDLSELVWADPLPLLYIALISANCHLTKEHIHIDLGPSKTAIDNVGNDYFLKFLGQQGFIAALGGMRRYGLRA